MSPGQNSALHRIRKRSISEDDSFTLKAQGSPSDPPTSITSPPGAKSQPKQPKSRAPSFSLPIHRKTMSDGRGAWTSVWNGSSGSMKRSIMRTPSRRKYGIIALLATTLLVGIWLWTRTYELQLEFSLFSRQWVKDEFDAMAPLKGCFDPANISPLYDLKRHLGSKQNMVSPGISLKRGDACFDFARTIQPLEGAQNHSLIYHTYWRSDLIPFGERHAATLSSFLATQPLSNSKLILWTNGRDVVANNAFVRPFLQKWENNFEVRQADLPDLTEGTELESMFPKKATGGGVFDKKGWVDGDAVRLLVLWHHGGVWFDMDQILTRDIHPLTEYEFVTQWDCYDKPYFAMNGALMHFRQHSPFLCEAFHVMATSPPPQPNTFTWGSHLYAKLHRRLLAEGQKPFAVLPWCFADPRNCRNDIRFPDPFEADPGSWAGKSWDTKGVSSQSGHQRLEERIGQIWTIHLHNQWTKDFPKNGWLDKLLKKYDRTLEGLARHRGD